MSLYRDFAKGILAENPTFRQVLGMCPTLAVTLSVENGLGMGFAATVVLVGSNVIISLMRRLVPDKIRIPAYIVVIATFVTVVDLVMAAFTPALHEKLGIFIPLIVVNCIIFARAESFASRQPVLSSLMDGLGMGLGFTMALAILGLIREGLGTGVILASPDLGFNGVRILGEKYASLIMILAPGGFITLGLVLGFLNWLTNRRSA